MRSEHIVTIDPEKCTGCWACVKDCPSLCLTVKRGRAEFRGGRCISCGHCAAVCPVGAVGLSGFDDPLSPVPASRPDPDELFLFMNSRRSTRQFKNEALPQEMLERLVEVGRRSATAVNRQGLSYVVLTEKLSEAEKLAVAYFRDPEVAPRILHKGMSAEDVPDNFFFMGAPAAILISGANKIDAGIAAGRMETMALAMGLGVLYSGFFSYAAGNCAPLRGLLGLGENENPAIALVLGLPDVKYFRSAPREKAALRWL